MTIDPISNDIEMVAGDTEDLSLVIANNGSAITYVPGDKVTLSVKKNIEDSNYSFQVVATLNPAQALKILPAHTKNLAPGGYVYDIEMSTAALGIKTIVKPARFIILRGVTNE